MLIGILLAGTGIGILAAGSVLASKSSKKNTAKFLVAQRDAESPHPLITSSADEEASRGEIETQVNQFFRLSSMMLAAAIFGALFYPPLSLLSLGAIFYAGMPIFHSARAALKEKRVNTDTADLILTAGMLIQGHIILAALTSWLGCLGFKLLMKTEDNSRKKLINVFGEQPRWVWVQQDGIEIQTPFEALQPGDIVVVNAGEMIPVDGVVTDGLATVDQHALTGEAQHVEKEAGESVFAATIVLSGRIYIHVEKAGAETAAAQIGEILNRSKDFKDTLQARGQQIADNWTLPTLIASGITWPFLGMDRALSIIWASFGYTMRLISPISVLNFLQILSQKGILIKDGRALESLSQVDTIVFDKTGTLTLEQPHVSRIYSCNGMPETELLTYAAAAEYRQSHPIAKAILEEAQHCGLSLPSFEEAAYEMGYGIKVRFDDRLVRVGSARLMEREGIELSDDLRKLQDKCNHQGTSLVYLALDEQLEGAIELRPSVRPEAKAVIDRLHERQISTYIISGDYEEPTRQLAEALDIRHYFAETLPENKAALVEQLRQEGKFVGFVGDGINDAIALRTANVSISLRGASTAATDTAQIILMDGTLTNLNLLFDIASDFELNMDNNLKTSVIPGIICLGGVFFLNFGLFTGMIIYNLSLLAGLINAMIPLLQHQTLPSLDDIKGQFQKITY